MSVSVVKEQDGTYTVFVNGRAVVVEIEDKSRAMAIAANFNKPANPANETEH